MKTIYKYPLIITDSQIVEMPKGAKILTVQTQNDTVCLLALVDTERPPEQHTIFIFGTGHPFLLNKSATYLGTVQTNNGMLVWHVFET